jgi:hypothetical protein
MLLMSFLTWKFSVTGRDPAQTRHRRNAMVGRKAGTAQPLSAVTLKSRGLSPRWKISHMVV